MTEEQDARDRFQTALARKEHGVLAGMAQDLMGAILARCSELPFERGDVLIRQGDKGDRMLFLVGGSLVADVVDEDGTKRRVGEFRPTDLVGEMAFVTGSPRMATVSAEEDGLALVLSAEDFQELAMGHPQLAVLLTHIVAERLGQESADGLGGKMVDGYRIHRCIGRGGMAIVYEARELESDRTVALKMMSHHLVYESRALMRFDREAEVVLTLDHPNITRVYRQFPGYRTQFMAMEYCDGGDLRSLIRRGPLPTEREARRMIGQIAAGLAYLHSRGIVHRDIKPGNVLVTRAGVLKLADFGLAREETLLASLPALTATGSIMGTPHYMAPEQLDGQTATPLSDVYSFGCVLLEILTGKPPFKGLGLLEMLEHKQHMELPERRELGPRGISRRLYSILEKCLAREPEERDVNLKALGRWGKPLTVAATQFDDDPMSS